MSKILHLEIDCCLLCPYCEYSSSYDMGQDAGMDCMHEDSPKDNRIVNEGGYKDIEKKTMYRAISSSTPDWCPLPNKGEKK